VVADFGRKMLCREIRHERQNMWVIPDTGEKRGPPPKASQFGHTIPDGSRMAEVYHEDRAANQRDLPRFRLRDGR